MTAARKREALPARDSDDSDAGLSDAALERKNALHERLLKEVAAVRRFVNQPAGLDASGSLRFDGPLLCAAARALARYDQIMGREMPSRRGVWLPEYLVLKHWERRRIQRALNDFLGDLIELRAIANPRDLASLRKALRFDGRDHAPARSRERQAQRSLAGLVRARLKRRVDDAGVATLRPGENLSAVYEAIARGFEVSPWTVRRAWIAAKDADPALLKLHTAWESAAKASRAGKPSEAPKARAARSTSRTAAKGAIDRLMSKKR